MGRGDTCYKSDNLFGWVYLLALQVWESAFDLWVWVVLHVLHSCLYFVRQLYVMRVDGTDDGLADEPFAP